MVSFHPNMGSVVDHSSQGRFFPQNSVSVVQRSSQGRFVFNASWPQKDRIWSKRIISGSDFFKIVDMLSDCNIFRVPSFRVP